MTMEKERTMHSGGLGVGSGVDPGLDLRRLSEISCRSGSWLESEDRFLLTLKTIDHICRL